MKTLLVLLLLATAAAAQEKYVPMSVKDFDAKPEAFQLRYLANFANVFDAQQAAFYKVAPADIRILFTIPVAPRRLADGVIMVYAGVELLKRQAKEGNIDLSKVYIEDVAQWAIHVKFSAHFP